MLLGGVRGIDLQRRHRRGALFLLGEISAAEKTERLDAIFRNEFTS